MKMNADRMRSYQHKVQVFVYYGMTIHPDEDMKQYLEGFADDMKKRNWNGNKFTDCLVNIADPMVHHNQHIGPFLGKEQTATVLENLCDDFVCE